MTHNGSASINHIYFMELALDQALKAQELGDSPVGALIVNADEIIGKGHNRIETDKDPTAHAEIIAIRQATRKIQDWRLPEATLYATLEPCVMCAAAILHARIKRVVFAAYDERWGAFGTLFDLSNDPRINHRIEILSGICAVQSRSMLQSFFRKLRD